MTSMKKNNAIVFGLTSNHVFAVACVMLNLKKINPDLADEIVIIHDGISNRDKKLLGTILPTRFILYDFPLKTRRVLESPSVRHFTKMVFSKFECLRLLDEYRNVMWLDYDMVIQNDISELLTPCDTGIKMMPGGLQVRGQLHAAIDGFDMNAEGICACVFVFQENLKSYQAMYEFCYAQTDKYAEILYMPEQAIFDLMIQSFGLKPIPIDGKIYSPHPTDPVLAIGAKIIHSYGQPKFWNGLHDDRWGANYKTWLNMGGTPYKTPNAMEKLLTKAKRFGSRLVSL